MKVALVTLGSAGDLYPFLALGRALRRAGHDVHLLSQAPYELAARAEGLSFFHVATQRDHDRTLAHPKLWHPIDGLGVLWRHLAVPAVEATVEALGELAHSGDADPLCVVASPLAVGARFAQERWPQRIRWASAYTAPMALREPDGPFFFGHHRLPGWCPPWVKRQLWRAVDRWKLEPMARPRLETWARQWKTAALPASVFGQWIHSPWQRLALYPAAFGTAPPGPNGRITAALGFPLYRHDAGASVSEEVAAFLARPGQTAVLYTGSAADDEGLQTATAACLADAGYRVLQIGAFLRHTTPDAPAVPAPTAASRHAVLRMGALPLHQVLRHAGLLVHHGGVGTLAEGWAAGVPQLMLPRGYDQFDNAARAARLGLGRWLPARVASSHRLAPALHAVRDLTATPHASPRIGGPDEFAAKAAAWLNDAIRGG